MRALNALTDSTGPIKSLRQWIALQKAPAIIELLKTELDANAYDKIIVFCVHRALIEENRALRVEVASLKDPKRLAALATEKYGLAPPKASQIIKRGQP